MENLKICKNLLVALVLILVGTIMISYVSLVKITGYKNALYYSYPVSEYVEEIKDNVILLESSAYKLIADDTLDIDQVKENIEVAMAENSDHIAYLMAYFLGDKSLIQVLNDDLVSLKPHYELILNLLGENKPDEALLGMKNTLSPIILQIKETTNELDKSLIMHDYDYFVSLEKWCKQTRYILIVIGIISIAVCAFFVIQITENLRSL